MKWSSCFFGIDYWKLGGFNWVRKIWTLNIFIRIIKIVNWTTRLLIMLLVIGKTFKWSNFHAIKNCCSPEALPGVSS